MLVPFAISCRSQAPGDFNDRSFDPPFHSRTGRFRHRDGQCSRRQRASQQPVLSWPSTWTAQQQLERCSRWKSRRWPGNGTGAPVNMTGCVAELYANGGTNDHQQARPLTATIVDGDVFVIANAAASAPIPGRCGRDVCGHATTTAMTPWRHAAGDRWYDVIGQIGFDPGTQWGTPPTSTLNRTLRRKGSVAARPRRKGSDVFDPAIEWDGFAIDDIANLRRPHLYLRFRRSHAGSQRRRRDRRPTPAPPPSPSPSR